ncbi:MAG: hypothetical protein IKF52_06185 [Clostridia bacterium]|nr:hypothetical protein [Clostridia bacterium]
MRLHGLMNILFGSLVLYYTYYIPDLGRATESQKSVATTLYGYIFVLMIVVLAFNLITLFFNRKDKVLVLAYFVAIISSAFYVFDMKLISILYILAAFLILIQVLRENVIVQSNTVYLIMLSIVIAAIGIVGINVFTFNDKVNSLNKIENKDKIEYDEDFFKYVSVLDDSDFYLNVQKDGKWGYINLNGETKIDYKYDYASPFVTIEKFDKKFDIALVCEDNTASLILKNERVVFSYKNEINVNDLKGQLDKLKEIYTDVLKQEKKFEDCLYKPVTSNFSAIKRYEDQQYRYPFNSEYDISIMVSQTGGKNRYEFVKKGSDTIRVSIDCDYLPFDDQNLYVFSNGYLPFYSTEKNLQGWYTKATRRVEMEGNIQILEFFDDKILIKDYDENRYYFINENKEVISKKYLDIYVASGGFIVKNEDEKYEVIDSNFNSIMNLDCDVVLTNFLEMGILICSNIPDSIEFNEYNLPVNFSYKLINVNKSAIIGEDFSNLYDLINENNGQVDSFIDDIKDIKYYFIGEKYYK